MLAKASVFVATSLDGFIARLDGSIDWLNEANAIVPEGEECGYRAFLETVDGIIMGRNTFEQVLTFGKWPYGRKKVIVLTRKGVVVPEGLKQTVSTSSEAPAALVGRLSATGLRHLYVDGGKTIQSFLRADLINELTITVIPILLGDGKPLFGSLPHDIRLTHLSTHPYLFGFVQSKYFIMRSA